MASGCRPRPNSCRCLQVKKLSLGHQTNGRNCPSGVWQVVPVLKPQSCQPYVWLRPQAGLAECQVARALCGVTRRRAAALTARHHAIPRSSDDFELPTRGAAALRIS